MKNKKLLSYVLAAAMVSTVGIAAGCTPEKGGNGDTPVKLSAPAITLTGNTITWNAVEHADGYSVYEGTTSVSTQTECSYTISQTTPGTYSYTVVATSTDEKYTASDKSNAVEYTVESGNPVLDATTVYMVGDSTMCQYKVNEGDRYLPRFGYGMELGLYLDQKATIVNLAASGRSSWSFPIESADNYAQLNNIKKGDYLIIGFGHNEQKRDVDHYSNAELSYTDTTQFNNRDASFKKILYDKYIKLALDKEATPILCTPIVRLNNKDNYTADSGHITADKTEGGITYAGGNYAKAIRDLGQELNLTVIDLTAITKADCESLKYATASNYYSFTDGLWSNGENSTVIRDDDSIDTTHTNLYGAKMNAYNLACELKKSDNKLGGYVKSDIVKPTYEADYEAGINKTYVPAPYIAFDKDNTTKSSLWTGITAPWYGTAFGDLGGNASTSNYKVAQNSANSSFTVGGLKKDKGKISNSSEGFAAVFQQIEANKDFKITVTATLDTYEATNQSGFGLMLRDDIYVDLNKKAIKSNYIAAGSYLDSGVKTIYSRNSLTSITASGKSATLSQGASFELSIQRTGNTITVKFGDLTEVYENFNLSAVDTQYDYICLYATRGITVTFSDVNLQIN